MDTLEQGVHCLFQVVIMLGGQGVVSLREAGIAAPDPRKGGQEQWTPGEPTAGLDTPMTPTARRS